ncbi:beta-glucosidase BglX [Rhizosphaericola mali]|nr:beta-glucosidase BglX [Rhizosphaericola mali]
MNKTTILMMGILSFTQVSTSLAQTKNKTAIYMNQHKPTSERVQDLLGKMTIAEKAGQLNQINGGAFTGPALNDEGQKGKMDAVASGQVGSMLNVIGVDETMAIQKIAVEKSRLGIPLLFGYDVIHGYKTIFPIPLAEACSWDLPQIEKNSAVAASEASAAGIHWAFAPMCDISNDPRWGRVMEGIGEDPWYGALVSAARVKGTQGDLSNDNLLACVKHFAAYGTVESGREYNFTDVSRFQLWNKYLPPYKAAVEAGAVTVMNGFTTFEGEPVSASKYLITDVLKNKWNFGGFLVSDWNSFGEMVTWGAASDTKEAIYKAFKAGSMMDMETRGMVKFIPELIKEGKITENELNYAVGKILEAKFKLGLFDDPYKFCNKERESNEIFTDGNKSEALKAAEGSIVLLKNDNNVLPLNISQKKIALIGELAASHDDMFDFWIGQGDAKDAISLKEGLENKYKSNVQYAPGYSLDVKSSANYINDAVALANNSDAVVVNIGISGKMAGEDRSLANPIIPENQVELLKALKKTGKPIVAVISAGRPLILTDILPYVDAVIYSWILGTETGNAITNILDGTHNPSAKTVMSFPYAVGQIPVYYNHFNTGRPNPTDDAGNWYSRYRDIPRDPLFPFGFGLSYSTFEYSNLKLNKTFINKNEKLIVTVELKNTGNYDGTEISQLYIRDVAASVIRPVKELKGFQKTLLKKGASTTLTFTIGSKELEYYNMSGDSVLEPGKFEVFVGGNSKDVLSSSFELTK